MGSAEAAEALTRSVKKKTACLWSLHCVHEGKWVPARKSVARTREGRRPDGGGAREFHRYRSAADEREKEGQKKGRTTRYGKSGVNMDHIDTKETGEAYKRLAGVGMPKPDPMPTPGTIIRQRTADRHLEGIEVFPGHVI